MNKIVDCLTSNFLKIQDIDNIDNCGPYHNIYELKY